jgi:MFS family permease
VVNSENLGGTKFFKVLGLDSIREALASSFLFSVGVLLQAASLGKHVFDITGRPIDIGFMGLAEFLPIFLLVFVSGSIVDRFDRKKIVLLAMTGELLCSLFLVWYSTTGPVSVFPLFACGLIFGTCRSFWSPAMRSLYPMLVPASYLPSIVAISSGVWTAAMIIGPAISGFLYSLDQSLPYATTAVLSCLGIISFMRVKLPIAKNLEVRDGSKTLRSAMEGLHFIRRTPILLAAISLDLFAVLFGGAIALLPVIAEEQLNVGDVAYGWLRAAAGIGAAAMALLLSIRPLRRNVGKALLIAVGVFGVGTIVLGMTHTYWIAFAAVLILSAADMVSVFIRGTIVPLVTPDSKRGRVSAVENVFIGATNELGAFESGVASQAFGTPATVIGGGVATLGIVVVWWFGFKPLRDIDMFSDLDAPENPA